MCLVLVNEPFSCVHKIIEEHYASEVDGLGFRLFTVIRELEREHRSEMHRLRKVRSIDESIVEDGTERLKSRSERIVDIAECALMFASDVELVSTVRGIPVLELVRMDEIVYAVAAVKHLAEVVCNVTMIPSSGVDKNEIITIMEDVIEMQISMDSVELLGFEQLKNARLLHEFGEDREHVSVLASIDRERRHGEYTTES